MMFNLAVSGFCLFAGTYCPTQTRGVFRSHASTEVLRPFYVDCFAYHFFSCHLTLRLSIDSTGASTGNDLERWRGAAAATAKSTGPWREVLPDACDWTSVFRTFQEKP